MNASEGDPTGDAIPTKIINIFAHARLSFATESQEISQWKRLLAFSSNNLNTCRAISLRLWTPGHTVGHLATGVPFSCALQQTGTTGAFKAPGSPERSTPSPAPNYNILNSFSSCSLSKLLVTSYKHFSAIDIRIKNK